MRIANANPEDAPVLTALAREAKASWGYLVSWMVAWEHVLSVSPDYLAAHLAFVAIEEDRRVGFAVVEITGQTARLEHLWVKPERMRSGIGRELFQRCEGAARLAGAEIIEIESDPYAEQFYLRMGAARTGEIPANVAGVKRSLPLLSKRLI